MSIKYGHGTLLTPAFQDLYHGDQIRIFQVKHLILCNPSANPCNVSLCILPHSGTPAQTNAILWTYRLAADTYIELCKDLVVNVGMDLQAACDAGNVVTAYLSGELDGQSAD